METDERTDATAWDLFCGAGGASWGISKVYRKVKGFDFWDLAVETHRANGMPAQVADLSKFRISTKRRGTIDLLWGSPPCQPFSGAIFNEGVYDERDGFPHYLYALDRLRPRLAIIENVAGLTYKRHASYLAAIIRAIEDLGYTVSWRVVDTSDFRIPQRRLRLIIIARLDRKPRWPKKNDEKVSVGEALRTDGIDNPVGHRVVFTKNPTMTGGFKGALLFNGRGRPLDLDQPSLTIYAAGGNHVHWFDTLDVARPYFEELKRRGAGARRTGYVPGARRLTVKQMARLQGFPKGFVFLGKPSAQVRQIGNALPPRMARLIVKANQIRPGDF